MSSSTSERFLSPRITPTAPLLADPCDYLKPHHSVGHCLTFTPETISEYFEETETGFSQVVAFRARNSVERRSYLPIGHGNFDASGFVEVESDGLPVDDLFAMQEMAEEFGGLGVFTYLGAYGSDGRFYGFSMYYEGHPVCSDVALSFVVDGVTGQVVACYDYMMEA